MPFYSPLKSHDDGERIVAGLRRLRTQLEQLPDRSLSKMLLASWNIREFDARTYGPRTDDAYYFIAEIISRFDIVAVQEVRRDLRALKAVMRILGRDWDYLVTDTTEGRPGNQERLAYVFDTTRVRPSGLVGEIVIPPSVAGDNVQLARTPLTAGFQCGWAKFQLTTVHILWGNDDENNPDRIREIDRLASFLADRAEDVQEIGDDNLVLLGDFNIFRPESATMEALKTHKWVIPEGIQSLGGTNVAGNKKYDPPIFQASSGFSFSMVDAIRFPPRYSWNCGLIGRAVDRIHFSRPTCSRWADGFRSLSVATVHEFGADLGLSNRSIVSWPPSNDARGRSASVVSSSLSSRTSRPRVVPEPVSADRSTRS